MVDSYFIDVVNKSNVFTYLRFENNNRGGVSIWVCIPNENVAPWDSYSNVYNFDHLNNTMYVMCSECIEDLSWIEDNAMRLLYSLYLY